MTGSTIFAGIVMTAAVVGGIMAWDFILSNIDDALNNALDEFGDSDTRTAALRNALDEGGEGRRQIPGGGSGTVEGTDLRGGNDASQITGPQSHFRTRPDR